MVSDNLEDAVYVALPEIITADAIVTFPVEEIDVPEASNVVPIELAFVATELVPERCVIAPPENKVEGPVGVLTEFPFNVNGTEMFIPPEDVVMDPVSLSEVSVEPKVCAGPEETLTDEIEKEGLVAPNLSINVPEEFNIVCVKSEFVETDTSELIPDEKDDPVYIPLDVEPENHKELSEVIVDSDTKAPEFDIQEIPPVDKNTPVFVMFVTPRAVTEDPEKFRKASLDTVVTEAVIIDPEEAGIEEPNVVSEFIAIKLLEDGNKENEFVPTLAEAELPVDGDDEPKFTP